MADEKKQVTEADVVKELKEGGLLGWHAADSSFTPAQIMQHLQTIKKHRRKKDKVVSP